MPRVLATLENLAQRFWSKVDRSADCWEWRGEKSSNGYGVCRPLGRKSRTRKRAHRVAYELTKGEIPEGLVVMHSCDNRSCVNPSHLSVGTQGDNLRDAFSKGRMNPRNAAKTHCLNGHPFDAANTIRWQRPGRRPERECRICKNQRKRDKRARMAMAS